MSIIFCSSESYSNNISPSLFKKSIGNRKRWIIKSCNLSIFLTSHTCTFRKTRGLGFGPKLGSFHRKQRWFDKMCEKINRDDEWKKPFFGSSHAKDIVLKKMYG